MTTEENAPQAAPDVPPPPTEETPGVLKRAFLALRETVEGPPQVSVYFVMLWVLAIALYMRSPTTNFIFDEQEALLANPYVRSVADAHPKFGWLDAFKRDFWGLPPDRSIGSYRPIPNLVWRALWAIGATKTPFLHHLMNINVHALGGALIAFTVWRWRRDRLEAWLAGLSFVACGVLTEAVSGVVGIADVFGGFGVILAIFALGLPLALMPAAVFLAVSFGLYSKESALCAVPLIPLAALLTSRYDHPERPLAPVRALVAFVASLAAFVAYVEARRRWFPVALPPSLSAEVIAQKPLLERLPAQFLRWYSQPVLPRDPINNPLADAPTALRIGGALRVYIRGLLQVLLPYPLSGDYSSPQEPMPVTPWFRASILGAVFFVGPLLASAVLMIAAWWKRLRAADEETALGRNDARPIVALGLVWMIVSYFPVSNIPVVLPTVRAERFWYFPVIGTALVVAMFLGWLVRRTERDGFPFVGVGCVLLFFGAHSLASRLHANDYSDDLAFWNATRKAAPRSAKAHLNYSVMLGARHDLEGRLVSNRVALDLSPNWPMANIYLGDTLCRLHRSVEAFPHYKRGFELAPNDVNLIALAIQCLWDEKAMGPGSHIRDELEIMAPRHPGTWVAYLIRDTIDNGETHKGVDPKHRPRGYNEGPKE